MFDYSEEISSPGMGVTGANLSREPLATEGEATSGPDDEVNWEELESADVGEQDDLPAFDGEVELPALAADLPKW